MNAKILTCYVAGVQMVRVRAGAKGKGKQLFECRLWKDNATDAAHKALAAWQNANPRITCSDVWGYDKNS